MASTAPLLGRIKKFLNGANVNPATRRSLQRYIDDPSLLDQLPPGVVARINQGDMSALQSLANTSSLPPVGKPVAVGSGVAATAAVVGGMAARDAGNRQRQAGSNEEVMPRQEASTADIDPLESASQTPITPEPIAGATPAPLPYQDEVERQRKWSEDRGIPFLPEDEERARAQAEKAATSPEYLEEDARLDDFEGRYQQITDPGNMRRDELAHLRAGGSPRGWNTPSGLPHEVSWDSSPEDKKRAARWVDGHPDGLEEDDPRWQNFVYEHGKGSARHKKYKPQEWEEWWSGQQKKIRENAQRELSEIERSNEAISPEGTDQMRYRAKLERQISTEAKAVARATGKPVTEVMSELIKTRPEYQPLQGDIVDQAKLGPERKYRPSDASQSYRNNMLAYRLQRGLDAEAEKERRMDRLRARGMLLGNNPRQNTANAYLMLGDPGISVEQRRFLENRLNPLEARRRIAEAENPPDSADGGSPLEYAQAEMMNNQGRQLAYADGLAAGQAAPAGRVEERRLALEGKYKGSPHKGAAMSGFDDGVQQSNPPAPPAQNAPGRPTLGVGVPTGNPSFPPIAPGF